MAIEPIKGFYVHDEATDTDGVAKYDYDELVDKPAIYESEIVDVDFTIVTGERMSVDTDEMTADSGFSRTDYIDCSNWETFTTTAGDRNAWYDKEHNWLYNFKVTDGVEVQVPNNAYFVIVCRTNPQFTTLTITATMCALDADIENIYDKIQNKVKIMPESLITGKLVYAQTGSLLNSENWQSTDYLELPFDTSENIEIKSTFYGIGGCAFYDENKSYISGINGSSATALGATDTQKPRTISVPIPNGAKYTRICANGLSYTASDLWVRGSTFGGIIPKVEEIDETIKELQTLVPSTVRNSKVLVLGDSISADAYGNYKKWVTDLVESGFLPTDTTNSSQHATGFVARYDNQANDFVSRLKAIQNPEQYNMVVVFGGINDYIQNVPMGSDTGTDYTTSFKPAVNEFFSYLVENFTQARLCVLLPLRTYATWTNSVGEYQQAYGEYIKTVAKSYCLPVLNLTEDSGFFPFNNTFRAMWTLQPAGYDGHDGVHPTEEYEKKYLSPMIRNFLQGLM